MSDDDGTASTAVQQASSASINTADFRYPYASSPDIIRSNQKDTYFQAVLLEHLSTILRNIKGSRFVHNNTSEAKLSADILYLGLTTLIGNRTLGEEYCDIVQVEDGSSKLPAFRLRAGYIASTIILPYLLSRVLPRVRRRLCAALEASLAPAPAQPDASNAKPQHQRQQQRRRSRTAATIQRYLLDNLDTITSPAPLYALSLATFYFSGAYYHLAKRLWGLRYVFTRTVAESEQRAGYEVLGVLLVLQLSVQAYLHLHSTVAAHRAAPLIANAPTALAGSTAVLPGDVEVSLDPTSSSAGASNALLFESGAGAGEQDDEAQRRIARATHTPPVNDASGPRIDLADKTRMRWLDGRQARKCTLCLEPMKDPSATTCGHLFCWSCIYEWLAEKHECPLCRQTCLAQHVLPLR